jgi:hypothetical protein
LTLAASATAATGTVTVTITGTSGSLTNSTTISLTVNALSGGQLVASPTSITFPNIYVGNKVKRTVTLKNVGTTYVVIGSVSITVNKGDASDFEFHRYCGGPLEAGDSCVIGVLFTPDAAGTDSGTLNIPSNAAGSPLEVPLKGTAIKKK